jgi:hypothetical protein
MGAKLLSEQEGCERLLEQGRALHSRAVYEMLVLVINRARTALKRYLGYFPWRSRPEMS